jgi:hypothetical protein
MRQARQLVQANYRYLLLDGTSVWGLGSYDQQIEQATFDHEL